MRYMISGSEVLPPIRHRVAKEIMVFATSIRTRREIKQVQAILEDVSGITDWNVDLEDWEKVLRVESVGVSSSLIINLISREGFLIKELE